MCNSVVVAWFVISITRTNKKKKIKILKKYKGGYIFLISIISWCISLSCQRFCYAKIFNKYERHELRHFLVIILLLWFYHLVTFCLYWIFIDNHYLYQIMIVAPLKMLKHHTMQGDTCPTEWYMSNGHSANWRVRLTSADWLKVDFWIHGPVAADTSYSERLLFVGLPLCDVCFCCHGNQFWWNLLQNLKAALMIQIKFDQDWQTDLGGSIISLLKI